jgi:hypothetical protein
VFVVLPVALRVSGIVSDREGGQVAPFEARPSPIRATIDLGVNKDFPPRHRELVLHGEGLVGFGDAQQLADITPGVI